MDGFRAHSRNSDCSDVISETKAIEVATRTFAAIERVSGRMSPYSRRADEIVRAGAAEVVKAVRLVAVVQSLSMDLKAGYLRSVEELIHGELFSDFLQMAQHLVETGYKDAAAVIAGSALEAHLRQLAKHFAVSVENSTARGLEPKKADQVNADLVKAGAYAVLDQKNVTAWLDLRNKAAHGRYSEYEKEQVGLMIDSIRDFMTRHPA